MLPHKNLDWSQGSGTPSPLGCDSSFIPNLPRLPPRPTLPRDETPSARIWGAGSTFRAATTVTWLFSLPRTPFSVHLVYMFFTGRPPPLYPVESRARYGDIRPLPRESRGRKKALSQVFAQAQDKTRSDQYRGEEPAKAVGLNDGGCLRDSSSSHSANNPVFNLFPSHLGSQQPRSGHIATLLRAGRRPGDPAGWVGGSPPVPAASSLAPWPPISKYVCAYTTEQWWWCTILLHNASKLYHSVL